MNSTFAVVLFAAAVFVTQRNCKLGIARTAVSLNTPRIKLS